MAIMEWFRVNGYNYMYGSLRLDNPIERLVFVELLALSSISRVRRTVCLSEGVPYPRIMLAGLIGISEEQLNDAIEHHTKVDLGRLSINQWGGIEIINWDKYQSESYDRVRKFREKRRKTSDVTGDVTESVTSCNAREENRIEENRIEENKPPISPPRGADISPELFEQFKEARMMYPGTKRGAETELGNLRKKYPKDWRGIIPAFWQAIGLQIDRRKELKKKGEFVPPWKHLKTYINNACWESDIG